MAYGKTVVTMDVVSWAHAHGADDQEDVETCDECDAPVDDCECAFCDECDDPLDECQCERCVECNERDAQCECERCDDCNRILNYCVCNQWPGGLRCKECGSSEVWGRPLRYPIPLNCCRMDENASRAAHQGEETITFEVTLKWEDVWHGRFYCGDCEKETLLLIDDEDRTW